MLGAMHAWTRVAGGVGPQPTQRQGLGGRRTQQRPGESVFRWGLSRILWFGTRGPWGQMSPQWWMAAPLGEDPDQEMLPTVL